MTVQTFQVTFSQALAGRDLSAAPFPAMRHDEVAGAALAGLRLGEVVCVPGLNDPSMTGAVSQAQQALLLAAVSWPTPPAPAKV